MGVFIVLEGIDGSGKSSLGMGLQSQFQARGVDSVLFQEPTKFETGIYLRKFLKGEIPLSPEEELEAFLADRRESVRRNILPSLKAGKVVILDRYFYSTAAYQANESRSPEFLLQKNFDEKFPHPDLLFFLEVKPELALERIQGSRENTEKFETLSHLTRIRDNYRKILPPDCIYLSGEESPDLVLEKAISKIPL
jgi:dTMP kinase